MSCPLTLNRNHSIAFSGENHLYVDTRKKSLPGLEMLILLAKLFSISEASFDGSLVNPLIGSGFSWKSKSRGHTSKLAFAPCCLSNDRSIKTVWVCSWNLYLDRNSGSSLQERVNLAVKTPDFGSTPPKTNGLNLGIQGSWDFLKSSDFFWAKKVVFFFIVVLNLHTLRTCN